MLEGFIIGLTGGARSSYEKLEGYERRIAIMREAAKEAQVENARAGYWQGEELWDTQKAMQVCISDHHWRHILQYPLLCKEEVREPHTYRTAFEFQEEYKGPVLSRQASEGECCRWVHSQDNPGGVQVLLPQERG